jgi:uncharacterized phage protein (TIGR01671 family)
MELCMEYKLKFRAWDRQEKTFYVPTGLACPRQMLCADDTDDDEFSVADFRYGYELDGVNYDPVMLYTGIQLNDGKEIYEGDILYSRKLNKYYEVKFGMYDNNEGYEDHEAGNGFYLQGDLRVYKWSTDYNIMAFIDENIAWRDFEWAGTIHTTPGLLNNIKD